MVGKNGDETLCHIQYECLPYFCYVCGFIGHKTQNCAKYFQGMGKDDFQSGNWLRAQPSQGINSLGR